MTPLASLVESIAGLKRACADLDAARHRAEAKAAERLDELERHASALSSEVHDLRPYRDAAERLREDLASAQIRAREIEIERDAAVKRAQALPSAELLAARLRKDVLELRAERAAAVEKVSKWKSEALRLRKALRDLTEVGEPPEGWAVGSVGDIEGGTGDRHQHIIADEVNGEAIFYGNRGRATLDMAVAEHFFRARFARQAQAALDGAPEPYAKSDEKSDAIGRIFAHGGRDLVAILAQSPAEPQCVDATNTGDEVAS